MVTTVRTPDIFTSVPSATKNARYACPALVQRQHTPWHREAPEHGEEHTAQIVTTVSYRALRVFFSHMNDPRNIARPRVGDPSTRRKPKAT
jgi:hypothetical protein